MLTEQHYEVIAKIINTRTFEYENRDCIDPDLLVWDLADYFAEDNPSFDRDRFLKASAI